ncbi:MAG: hypothetical protein ACTSQJ_17725 [Promethearchaeota archaeon]
MAEMLTDLLQNIYNRIAGLGKSIQELKGSLDSLNKNIEQKITTLSDMMSEFKTEIESTQTKHIDALKLIGTNATKEIMTIKEGLGMNALNHMIESLENFSKLSEEILNQDTVNMLLSEAIESVKQLKQGITKEE